MAVNKIPEEIKVRHALFKELIETFELFPDKDVARHIVTIMRPSNAAYHWTNKELLEKIKSYKRELECDEDED